MQQCALYVHSGMNIFRMSFDIVLVKESIRNILDPLMHIIHSSFRTGIVPSSLKIAKVVPIYKSGKKINYQTIVLSQFYHFFSKYLKKLYTIDLLNI